MKTKLLAGAFLLAFAHLSMCSPPTAEDRIAARRAGGVPTNPNAQPLAVINREFISQDAERRARQYADGSRYGMVVPAQQPQEIPNSVHTVILYTSIRDANIVYQNYPPRK